MLFEIILISAGFFALAALVFVEGRRRQFWEQAMGYKIREGTDDRNALAREVVRNTQDISSLKRDVADTMARMQSLEKKTKAPSTAAAQMAGSAAPLRAARLLPPLSSAPGLRAANDRTERLIEPRISETHSEEQAPLSTNAIRAIVDSALQTRQITVFVQPIMRLPQRKVRFYEMYARLRARPGLYLPMQEYQRFAGPDAQAEKLDVALLEECLRMLVKTAYLSRAIPFFLNITPRNLASRTYMKTLLAFLTDHRHLAPRLIFEITQADLQGLNERYRDVLKGISRLGCGIGVDQASHTDFDLPALQALGVRAVKVPAQVLLGANRNERTHNAIKKVKTLLEGNGIAFIVTRVEDENTMKALLDYDLHFGQGHLFGRPDLQGAYQQKRVA